MRIETYREIARREKVETRQDETAFLVSSRREILDLKFLDPPLLWGTYGALWGTSEAL